MVVPCPAGVLSEVAQGEFEVLVTNSPCQACSPPREDSTRKTGPLQLPYPIYPVHCRCPRSCLAPDSCLALSVVRGSLLPDLHGPCPVGGTVAFRYPTLSGAVLICCLVAVRYVDLGSCAASCLRSCCCPTVFYYCILVCLLHPDFPVGSFICSLVLSTRRVAALPSCFLFLLVWFFFCQLFSWMFFRD